MSLYAIGDLHLSIGGSKPMDIFGDVWVDHVEKLRRGFEQVKRTDVVVLCGDLSWAMGLAGATADFNFISELPGKKYIVKGNHDYWWQTAGKLNAWFAANGWTDMALLHNCAALYNDGDTAVALCGTRGWFFEEQTSSHNAKIYKRELMRLEASLKCGRELGADKLFAFLHYPPLYGNGYECAEIIELLEKYGVEKCYYGHLHGSSVKLAVGGVRHGIDFTLVSADSIGFEPVKII